MSLPQNNTPLHQVYRFVVTEQPQPPTEAYTKLQNEALAICDDLKPYKLAVIGSVAIIILGLAIAISLPLAIPLLFCVPLVAFGIYNCCHYHDEFLFYSNLIDMVKNPQDYGKADLPSRGTGQLYFSKVATKLTEGTFIFSRDRYVERAFYEGCLNIPTALPKGAKPADQLLKEQNLFQLKQL